MHFICITQQLMHLSW